jgi:hypothetical protein
MWHISRGIKMGYYHNIIGEIDADSITDFKKIRAILAEDVEWDDFIMVDEVDGMTFFDDQFKDYDDWLEELLSKIAPYIKGRHVIEKFGEDNEDYSNLIIQDGKLYVCEFTFSPGPEVEFKTGENDDLENIE